MSKPNTNDKQLDSVPLIIDVGALSPEKIAWLNERARAEGVLKPYPKNKVSGGPAILIGAGIFGLLFALMFVIRADGSKLFPAVIAAVVGVIALFFGTRIHRLRVTCPLEAFEFTTAAYHFDSSGSGLFTAWKLGLGGKVTFTNLHEHGVYTVTEMEVEFNPATHLKFYDQLPKSERDGPYAGLSSSLFKRRIELLEEAQKALASGTYSKLDGAHIVEGTKAT